MPEAISLNGTMRIDSTSRRHLDTLNPQQRLAVTHGEEFSPRAVPLPIIAGGGSGKTNTLAHRAAHLIVKGADPSADPLLAFSRRAAAEMAHRDLIN